MTKKRTFRGVKILTYFFTRNIPYMIQDPGHTTPPSHSLVLELASRFLGVIRLAEIFSRDVIKHVEYGRLMFCPQSELFKISLPWAQGEPGDPLVSLLTLTMVILLWFSGIGKILVKRRRGGYKSGCADVGVKGPPCASPGFTYFKANIFSFFTPAHILHILASLTSTQFLSSPRKSRWFIILPRVNFTCPLMQFSTDVMKNSFSVPQSS